MAQYTLGNVLTGMFAAAGVFLSVGITLGKSIHPKPQPSYHIETQVYDCINIQHAPDAQRYPSDHAARYALQRLHTACAEQENALALMHIWSNDPAAGEVLEPQP
ncbi:hypothetical protein ACKLNO_03905 [Neisseriaceae bacterium B1]